MTKKPSQSEIEILQSLWDRKVATVRDIHTDIQAHRTVTYTTTLKQVQRMLKTGMVEKVSSDNRAHTYRSLINPQKTRQELVSRLIDSAFDGSAQALVLHALGKSKPSAAQIEEIKSLLKKLDNRD